MLVTVTPLRFQHFEFKDDKGQDVKIERTTAMLQIPGERFTVQIYLQDFTQPLGVDYEAEVTFLADKKFNTTLAFGEFRKKPIAAAVSAALHGTPKPSL